MQSFVLAVSAWVQCMHCADTKEGKVLALLGSCMLLHSERLDTDANLLPSLVSRYLGMYMMVGI
jgi:hypothetical protein